MIAKEMKWENPNKEDMMNDKERMYQLLGDLKVSMETVDHEILKLWDYIATLNCIKSATKDRDLNIEDYNAAYDAVTNGISNTILSIRRIANDNKELLSWVEYDNLDIEE